MEHYLQMGGHHNQEEEADLDASAPPAGSSKLHSQSHHTCILGASAREQMSGADEQDGIRWICVLHIYVNFHKGPHWADICFGDQADQAVLLNA